MCEAAVESPVSYDINRSHSSKQPHQSRLEKLLERLPRLGEEYELDHKVGEGTFSSVYVGSSRLDPKLRVAVKHLIPTCHPTRIARELKCMHHLGGVDNIVSVISCYRMNDCVVFVMPYQPHDKFNNYVAELSAKELQTYLRGLLVALHRVHSHGVIHRDIKPSNFLFHRKTQRFLLVDFGLAQHVEECTNSDSSENFSSIKIELVQPEANQNNQINTDKKRKRDSIEEGHGVSQVIKRPALRPISNNVTPSKEDRLNIKNTLLSKSYSENINNQSMVVSKRNSILRDCYLQSKEKNQQSPLVVKRNPFNHSFSSSNSPGQNNFVRIHNSQQVKLVGGMFAKPMPVSGSPGVAAAGRSSSSSLGSPTLVKQCHCDGRPRVCNICLTRRARAAPRAGTPGFRPPEVLLKYPNQTTAVDIWAVGVIMLSIMSSTYPFFKSPDDITALAELITIFGSDKMKSLAKKLGRNIVCSENRGALDLRKLCEALRRRRSGEENSTMTLSEECPKCKMSPGEECLCATTEMRPEDPRFPGEAYELLHRFLDIDPDTRITAEDALKHPFFSLKL